MKKKNKLNRALRILLVTNGLILLAGTMLGPIYALFVEKVGGDLMDASIAGGIFAFVAGLTTLLSGKYTDKVKDPELIIVLGYAIMGFGFLMYFFVSSVIWLFVVQAIIGLGEAIYSPSYDTVYTIHLTGNKSGSQWGAWESMNYFIMTFGAIIGGSLVTLFGFYTLFIVMSLLCFSSALYILKLNRKVL